LSETKRLLSVLMPNRAEKMKMGKIENPVYFSCQNCGESLKTKKLKTHDGHTLYMIETCPFCLGEENRKAYARGYQDGSSKYQQLNDNKN
jgi:hypothetical protein